jgi:antitoxin (DNA-binding transcriptional repressor) of toxin-antitoxin stability system
MTRKARLDEDGPRTGPLCSMRAHPPCAGFSRTTSGTSPARNQACAEFRDLLRRTMAGKCGLERIGDPDWHLAVWDLRSLSGKMESSTHFTDSTGGTAMTQVTVTEAQQRLPELLDAVEAGEEVEIRTENRRSYRLTPTRPRPPVTGVPKAGRLKGQLVVPPDFDEPLEELREYME